MCKILPRGQPPLRRQREVSGSSKVDKGAPRCVPAGLPQGMVRFPPRCWVGGAQAGMAVRDGLFKDLTSQSQSTLALCWQEVPTSRPKCLCSPASKRCS